MENIVADLFAKKETPSTNENFRSNINPTKIKVVGVGGGGGNAVNRMIRSGLTGVEFWLMNTDMQALSTGQTKNRIQLGSLSTHGLGAGNDPTVGEKAAEEAHQEITQALDGSDMVFITAGMGGGTGTGAAPVVAKVAKELGILTVGVVTKPFSWEGKKRMNQANAGLDKLKEYVDAVIVVPNDKLLQVVGREYGLLDSFGVVDEVLLRGVQGLTDIITVPGIINVDFADVKSVMQNSGSALMGIGKAQGEGRAVKAAQQAINSQLLEASINGASGVIVNITGGPDMGIHEVSDAASIIHDAVLDDATVIVGTTVNDAIKDGSISITVIATGFELRNSSPVNSFNSASSDLSKLNAADYFSGAFDTQPKSVMNNNNATKDREASRNFNNIEIPDFLKR
ncbi:MAG: cell division protein FtsZ [Cyanobacteriota bacterium]|nr:cell division protein FtsZ [Cyanobacteriota bacterium]MDY6359344.1 cell division protein FtsZ [Cyanobacteriota bacterium]MDY6363922.1 cell division protein FtsZ [Cyanobacteriota bacterium]MDY6383309.1 cell division protein FtsZ [Cyanobacteriota bacterium]